MSDLSREVVLEALGVMRDGGNRLCDEAIRKWRSGTYPGIDPKEHIARWETIRGAISELTKRLKEKA